MKILLHLCCAPCATYPVKVLLEEGHQLRGFFYNPNIHPFQEFRRRLVTLEKFSASQGLNIDYVREYGLREFLRRIVFNEEQRCPTCYELRLEAAARQAAATGAEAFTSTLLYSRYQKHDAIRTLGERLAAKHGVQFYYRDFREGWQAGIDMSVDLELYRQPYCGCIFSEEERYDQARRRRRKQAAPGDG